MQFLCIARVAVQLPTTAPVYVFIGKLLSCLAKRKTISALCVPACRLQHTLSHTECNGFCFSSGLRMFTDRIVYRLPCGACSERQLNGNAVDDDVDGDDEFPCGRSLCGWIVNTRKNLLRFVTKFRAEVRAVFRYC